MASVQFVGRTPLMEGVRDRLDVWGLFQGKQFLVSGDTPESLDEFLKKLEPGGTVAVYTLRFYTVAEADEIDEKTPSQGAINFKLTGPAMPSSADQSTNARLARIENLLAGTLEADDDDEPDDDPPEESIASIILGYLKDPQKIATIVGAFNSLKQGTLPPELIPGSVGAFNHKQDPAPGEGSVTSEANINRLSVVLDRLERADARILDHLEKLADLAEKKPDLFKLLIAQLDSGL